MRLLLTILAAAIAFAVLVLAMTIPVRAGGNCHPTRMVETQLMGQYGERVIRTRRPTRRANRSGQGTTYRLWFNAKTKSWTLTETTGRRTCIVKAGKGDVRGKTIGDILHPNTVRT